MLRKHSRTIMATVMAATIALVSTGVSTTVPAAQPQKLDVSKKIKLKFNVIDTDKQNKDIRYDVLREKFNIEFDLVACSLNDIAEKSRIWMASGDMPEMMWTSLSNASELRTWATSGSLKPLTNLKNFSNLWKLKEKQQYDDALMIDGKDYFVSGIRDTGDIGFKALQAFIYRKDWAQKLNMYKTTYTWDEMIALAKAMVQKDPGQNGAGKTIGMLGVAWGFPGFAGLQQISPYWSTFTQKDGAYVWGPDLPETLEGLKMAKRLIDENVLWGEQSLAKTLDGPAKFQSGQAGILYHNLTSANISNIMNGLEETYPGSNALDMVEIMNVKSPDGKFFSLQAIDSWGSICFSKNIDEEKLTRALAMYDWLLSDEGKMLLVYGVEGKDYKKNADKIEMLWKKDAAGNYVTPYQTNSDRILSMLYVTDVSAALAEYAPPKIKSVMTQLTTFLGSDDMKTQLVDYNFNAFSAPNKDKFDVDPRNKIIELLVTSKDIEKDYKAWLATQQQKKNAVLNELNDKAKK